MSNSFLLTLSPESYPRRISRALKRDLFSAINNQLINDGCGLFRGRQILPFEHLSRFQNDLID